MNHLVRKTGLLAFLISTLLLFSLSISCGSGGSGIGVGITVRLGDFEGTWFIGIPLKADSAAQDGWYFSVDGEGNVIPEPEDIGSYPIIIGGHLTLENSKTGVFSATIELRISAILSDTETVAFTGTLDKEQATMNATFAWGNREITKQEGASSVSGFYSLEVFKDIEPFGEKVIDDIVLLTLNGDGTFTTSDSAVAGTWNLFREAFIYGLREIDEDGDEIIDTIEHIHLRLLTEGQKADATPGDTAADLEGTYTVEITGEDPENGYITGFELGMDTANFTIDDLASTWSICGEEENGGAEEYFQHTGFVINTDGIPAQSGGITGGSIDDFDPITGAFTLTLIIDDGEETETSRIIGFLSPSGLYGAATEYNADIPGEKWAELIFVNEECAVLEQASRVGYWSLGLYDGISTSGLTLILNFEAVVNGMLRPLPGQEFGGSIALLAPHLYSVLIETNGLYGWDDGTQIHILCTIAAGTQGVTDAIVQINGHNNDADIRITDTGVLYRYEPATVDKLSFAREYAFGALDATEHLSAIIYPDIVPGQLMANIDGVVYNLQWELDIYLRFFLFIDGLGEPDILFEEGDGFFFTPPVVAEAIGGYALFTYKGLWAYEMEFAPID